VPPVPLDDIEPINIRQYMDWRGKTAKIRANREKALLSHIWNFARESGITNKPNPCAGIKGFKEAGRDVYIEDDIYKAVWVAAEEPLRDALDLAYLTGQRPADTLKLSRADIKDEAISIVQNKTGKKLRIAIEGDLAALIRRISSRKVMGLKLINTKQGYPMSASALRGAFDRARTTAILKHPELAADIRKFQFRDLRAKAGTDKEESSGMGAAQDQLGHSTPTMTAHYVRHRKGKLVKPTK
jgi:integrase